MGRLRISTFAQLVSHTENELRAFKNCGDTTIHEIQNKLAERGLRLGMDRFDWMEASKPW
jgi:DNA-directed RNA polymerase alpha subunit